jgi:hypothetical protein
MRAIALCLLLLGAVVYLLPTFKDVLPLHLAIANNDAQVLGNGLLAKWLPHRNNLAGPNAGAIQKSARRRDLQRLVEPDAAICRSDWEQQGEIR